MKNKVLVISLCITIVTTTVLVLIMIKILSKDMTQYNMQTESLETIPKNYTSPYYDSERQSIDESILSRIGSFIDYCRIQGYGDVSLHTTAISGSEGAYNITGSTQNGFTIRGDVDGIIHLAILDDNNKVVYEWKEDSNESKN